MNNVAQRKRVSPYKMFEVEEALQIILKESVPTIVTEIISYKDAMNRVLAEEVFASEPIPSFRAAIKDGYAGISTDQSSVRKVIKAIAAGDQVI